MKRAVLVSGHYVGSRRRAGFHFIADALVRAGWHVSFLTAGISHLSWLKRDHRLQYGIRARSGRMETVTEGLDSFVWYTPFHPLNRMPALANRLLDPLLRRYGSLPLAEAGVSSVRQADLIVFESTAGVMLFDRFKGLNAAARYAYRMSDDLRLLRAHPRVVRAEDALLPQVELISIPTESMYRRFSDLPGARLQHHGIDKEAFDSLTARPYEGDAVNVVFVGSTHFDVAFLEIAARSFPEWAFHVIGPIGGLPARSNIVTYGELPFAQTIPYLRHADIGLNTLRQSPWTESLADSLKVIQYSYLRLPVVMPNFMSPTRPNAFTYRTGDEESIRDALNAARSSDRSAFPIDDIWSWDELAARISGDVPS